MSARLTSITRQGGPGGVTHANDDQIVATCIDDAGRAMQLVLRLSSDGSGSVRGTVDTTEVGDNNAGLRSEVAFNGDSQLLMPAIAGGILTAHVALDGGVLSGSSAVMDLRGWNWRAST